MIMAAAEGSGRNGEQLEHQRKAARNERRNLGAMVFTARRALGRQPHAAYCSRLGHGRIPNESWVIVGSGGGVFDGWGLEYIYI